MNPVKLLKQDNQLSVEKFGGYYIITDREFKGAFIYRNSNILPLVDVLSLQEVEDFKSKIIKGMEWV